MNPTDYSPRLLSCSPSRAALKISCPYCSRWGYRRSGGGADSTIRPCERHGPYNRGSAGGVGRRRRAIQGKRRGEQKYVTYAFGEVVGGCYLRSA